MTKLSTQSVEMELTEVIARGGLSSEPKSSSKSASNDRALPLPEAAKTAVPPTLPLMVQTAPQVIDIKITDTTVKRGRDVARQPQLAAADSVVR